jgi:hypothetical protein
LIVVEPFVAPVTCSAVTATFFPVAPGASYDAIVSVFVPAGTVALTVHVNGVVAVGAVQPADCGVRFAVTSTVPVLFAIVSDCVDGLTYAGRRSRAAVLVPDGTRITKEIVAGERSPAPGVGATDAAPPPHAASDEANKNTKTARRTTGDSPRLEKGPVRHQYGTPGANSLAGWHKESARWPS